MPKPRKTAAGTPATKSSASSARTLVADPVGVVGRLAEWEAAYNEKSFFFVRLSETAITHFLGTRFTNNVECCDRSRARGRPVYPRDFYDHGTKRVIQFSAQVL